MFPPLVISHCLKQRLLPVTFSSLPSTSVTPGQPNPNFISALNNLDNVPLKKRQKAHMPLSAVTSGRKAETGSWGIGVRSQKFPNHL